MPERIRPDQKETALRSSKRFEHAWRVYTHPSRYADEELKSANRLIIDSYDYFETVISCPPDPDGWEPEVFDKVFAGLYHTTIRYPDKPQERNFREN